MDGWMDPPSRERGSCVTVAAVTVEPFGPRLGILASRQHLKNANTWGAAAHKYMLLLLRRLSSAKGDREGGSAAVFPFSVGGNSNEEKPARDFIPLTQTQTHRRMDRASRHGITPWERRTADARTRARSFINPNPEPQGEQEVSYQEREIFRCCTMHTCIQASASSHAHIHTRTHHAGLSLSLLRSFFVLLVIIVNTTSITSNIYTIRMIHILPSFSKPLSTDQAWAWIGTCQGRAAIAHPCPYLQGYLQGLRFRACPFLQRFLWQEVTPALEKARFETRRMTKLQTLSQKPSDPKP